ncbi:MAG: DUF4258 domain-containing protein [Planktothrix sp.]
MKDQVLRAIKDSNLVVAGHASDRLNQRNISLLELLENLKEGELLKEYPPNPPRWPLPSCLILSFNQDKKPIHSVWAFNSNTGFALLITAYHPDPETWDDFRTRKK